MNMKHFLAAALLLCLSVGTSAQSLKPQNLQGFDYRGFHFGFLLSLNTSDFYIRVKPDYDFENRLLSIDNASQSGFNLALLASADVTQNVHARFIPGLSFQDRGLYYRFLNDEQQVEPILKRTESVYLDLPVVWKLRTNRINNFAAYALIGGKYSIDMQSQKDVDNQSADEKILKLSKTDYSIDAGGGIDFFLPYFKFGMEVKVATGLKNVLIQEDTRFSSPIESLRTRSVIVSFTFEG